MKRITCFMLALFCVASAFVFTPAAENIFPSVSAKSAILMSSDGRVLYEKNPFLRLPMASTTKIMTAVVALENASPSDNVTVTRESVGIEGSSVYLCEGEILTLLELLYALLLSSANDAASAIALHIGKSEESFVALMNKKAQELGLYDTHFENPHGLDHKDHYTTAYDLARLTAYALENESFSEIVSTRKKEIRGVGDTVRYLVNHNRLLASYEGILGVKTGFTKKSGRCLVTAARRDGLALIAVTLSAPDDWNDHGKMLDYGFSYYENAVLCDAGQLFYTLALAGKGTEIQCVTREDLSVTVPRGHRDVHVTVELPRFLWEFPETNERLGRVVFRVGSKTYVAELFAA